MGHDHPHSHDEAGLDRRLWASGLLNALITVAEVVGGLCAGSLALLSDAAHNFSDLAAVIVALYARRLSHRPPTPRHTYGLKRAEVMAALGNAIALLVVTMFIAREAVVRILNPEPVAQGLMLAVAVVALVANVASALLLGHHDTDDLNVRSAYLHMVQDAYASLAVVIAALLAHTGIGVYVDPIASIVVGFAVFRSALALIQKTVSTLLEGAPHDVDVETLAQHVDRTFAPACLHHVHVWEIGHGQRLLTAHVMLGQDMEARAIEVLFEEIKASLHERWCITHSTLEPEVIGCGETDLLGKWRKAASRHTR